MEWKPIFGVKNYEASDEGDIRNSTTGKILSRRNPQVSIPTKYCVDVSVAPHQLSTQRGSMKTLMVTRGRLCCLAFHGPPSWHNFVVGFKDKDSTNCNSDNLEWRESRNIYWKGVGSRSYPERIILPE